MFDDTLLPNDYNLLLDDSSTALISWLSLNAFLCSDPSKSLELTLACSSQYYPKQMSDLKFILVMNKLYVHCTSLHSIVMVQW